MKKKMHVVRLQGRGGYAQRVLIAEQAGVRWIVMIKAKRSFEWNMAGALTWLEYHGVTDIKRVSKMSL